MLVSIGSALFVLVPLQMVNAQVSQEAVSRIIQGIAAGVGFLGAGEIMRSRPEVGKEEIHGLTSAASIWVSAALGITAGCGLWQMGLIGGLLSWLVLRVFKKIEKVV